MSGQPHAEAANCGPKVCPRSPNVSAVVFPACQLVPSHRMVASCGPKLAAGRQMRSHQETDLQTRKSLPNPESASNDDRLLPLGQHLRRKRTFRGLFSTIHTFHCLLFTPAEWLTVATRKHFTAYSVWPLAHLALST